MTQQVIHVFIIGASGLIGNEVAKILVDLPDKRIVLRGICDSQHALYVADQSIIAGWRVNKDKRWRVEEFLSSAGTELVPQYDGSREALLTFTASSSSSVLHTVIVDCTASEIPSSLYGEWLNSGSHVVTANKKGTSCCTPAHADL